MSNDSVKLRRNLVREAETTPGLFRPNYGRCIHMALPTALSFLGHRLPEREYSSLSDSKNLRRIMETNSCFDAEKVIIIVADSVGIEQFQQSSYLLGVYRDCEGFELSSVFPTITSTALASIHLATTPGRHGIFGHKIFFKELGAVVDTLKMSTMTYGVRDALTHVGVDVRGLTYCRSPYDLVEKEGIDHIELLEDEIAGTGLSNLIYKKQVAHGFSNLIDAFSTARNLLEENRDRKLILNLYTGILDSLSHKYGPFSEEYRLGINLLEDNIKRLTHSVNDNIAERTTLIFFSDHGQDQLDPAQRITFTKNEIEELSKFLRAPPGKSGRVIHFYTKPEFQEEALRAIRNKIGERGYIITFEEAIRNFIGKTKNVEMSRSRLGDLLVVLKKGASAEILRENTQTRMEEQLLGSHGSATMNEILVPFFSARLSKLKRL